MSAARGRSAYLALGSAAASAFNFYTFILLPSFSGTEGLSTFVRDNYLGGAYLFGIGSSIAPLAVYILNYGRQAALRRYVQVSAAMLALVAVGGAWLARLPWSYLCLAGALGMHAAGFFLAALIQEERLRLASALQVVQPFLFAALVTASGTGLLLEAPWAALYVGSAAMCAAAFWIATPWAAVRARLQMRPEGTVTLRAVVERSITCVSFPIFFQLELIVCGTLTEADLGVYTMVQRLYSSVAISLFGTVGVLMVMRGTRPDAGPMRMLPREGWWMALACALSVLLVGAIVSYVGRAGVLSPPLVAAAAALGLLFTLCSLAGLVFSVAHPFLGLRVFGLSLALYVVAFFLVRPVTIGGLLGLTAVFLGAYLALATGPFRVRGPRPV